MDRFQREEQRMQKKLVSLLLLGLILALSGCGDHGGGGRDTLSQIRRTGELHIGSVPFGAPLLHQVNSEYVGPEAELANLIAKRIGNEIDKEGVTPFWLSKEYESMAENLKNNGYDFIISVYGKTPQRVEDLAFSQTYYTSELVMAVNPLRNGNLTPSSAVGKKIGVRRGTAIEKKVRSKYTDSEIIPIETLDEAILQLRSGEVDAVVDDLNMSAYVLDTIAGGRNLEIVGGVIDTIEVGIALRKSDTDTVLPLVDSIVNEAKDKIQGWIEVQFPAERLQAVKKRRELRILAEKQAATPRRVTIRISKSANNTFDIYRVANLSFRLANQKTDKTYQTSKIKFRGRTGVSSTRVPPGRYTVSLPKFGITFGTAVIEVQDPDSVRLNLRLGNNNSISMTKAS